MKAIAQNLAAQLHKSKAADKHSVVVTTKGKIPDDYNLKAFEGLNGLYHGKLSKQEIKKLAQLPGIQAVELDNENTIQ